MEEKEKLQAIFASSASRPQALSLAKMLTVLSDSPFFFGIFYSLSETMRLHLKSKALETTTTPPEHKEFFKALVDIKSSDKTVTFNAEKILRESSIPLKNKTDFALLESKTGGMSSKNFNREDFHTVIPPVLKIFLKGLDSKELSLSLKKTLEPDLLPFLYKLRMKAFDYKWFLKSRKEQELFDDKIEWVSKETKVQELSDATYDLVNILSAPKEASQEVVILQFKEKLKIAERLLEEAIQESHEKRREDQINSQKTENHIQKLHRTTAVPPNELN